MLHFLGVEPVVLGHRRLAGNELGAARRSDIRLAGIRRGQTGRARTLKNASFIGIEFNKTPPAIYANLYLKAAGLLARFSLRVRLLSSCRICREALGEYCRARDRHQALHARLRPSWVRDHR